MLTIGHSVLTIDRFLAVLGEQSCRVLVDVRRYPVSRRNPQYSQGALFAALKTAGIQGIWREGLGGHRTPQPNSVNTAMRESFRGYADYMQTPVFAAQIDWLLAHPEQEALAVMCAEGDPSHCHRSLIADAVTARGVAVEHILVPKEGASVRRLHVLSKMACVEGQRVWYPAEQGLFG